MSIPRTARRSLCAGTAFALVAAGLVATATPASASASPPAALSALDTAYTQLTNLDPAGPGPLIGPYEATRAAIRASLVAIIGGRPPAEAIAAADQAITAALLAYHP